MDIKLKLGLGQQLLMTPQLQQAIKLLQLSRMELQDFIQDQLAENPVLEEGQDSSNEEQREVEKNKETSEKDVIAEHMNTATEIVDRQGDNAEKPEIDWEQYSKAKESEGPVPSSMVRKGDDDTPNYENMVTRSATFQEHLFEQVGELDLDDKERAIANLIIGNIDDRGYLKVSLEELTQDEGYTTEELDDILDTIQRFEPAGVGARDLKECLLIQIRAQRLKNGIVEKIVELHLTDLETRNYNAIAKALKIPLETVIENVQTISLLEPVPGRQYGRDETQYIIPDVYVFQLGEEWIVGMNDDGIPRLTLSEMYKEMAEDGKAKSDDKEYLQDKIKAAQWLIKSIQQRQKTIFKVMESIVKRQKEFFEKGIEHLKPMILKDIAEDVEMHESTISRVTTNKYVHTPRGIFELKYFFNSSVARADGGDSMASESVKKMISDLIKAENTKKPYSDQKIVDMLEEKGVQLARRTVAKYREQMGILPSSKRKKYF